MAETRSTERLQQLESMVPALHFAVSRLWIKEFERASDPAAAATQYAAEVTEIFSSQTMDAAPRVRDSILGLFEQIAVELGSPTKPY